MKKEGLKEFLSSHRKFCQSICIELHFFDQPAAPIAQFRDGDTGGWVKVGNITSAPWLSTVGLPYLV